MTAHPLSGVDPLLVAYVLAFGVAAVVCFVTLRRTHRIEDADTRRGLSALLVLSGGWASVHVAFLVVPSQDLKYLFYTAGLVIGLTTILPWLYFCSAYTGRTLHRNPAYRRALGGVFLFIILLKITNPVHGVYFTVAPATTPFPYLAVNAGIVHWIVMGLSYVLAAIGYFMLLELFSQVSHDTKPLAALAGLAGSPVLLDVAALVVPGLLKINYEPLGVAAFGVGVLFLYLGDFRMVQLAGEHDDPVIILDQGDRVRDYNASAREIFPELVDSIGSPIGDTLPNIAERLGADETIVEVDLVGGLTYYGVTKNPFTAGQTRTGTLLSFTDVTDREEYRRKLERQNERLEQFASMVSHDLRNPLTVAKGNVELARKDRDAEELQTAVAALDRMEALIDDMLALARQGQPIDAPEPVDLSAITERCWTMIDSGSADLVVAENLTIRADPDRLQQLLENLFRNAVEHGSTSPQSQAPGDAVEHGSTSPQSQAPGDAVEHGSTSPQSQAPGDAVEHGGEALTVTVGGFEGGFFVADDGRGIPAEERDRVFDAGYSTNEDGTGFGLHIVKEVARAHGWEIRATESQDGGARFEITGVDIDE